MTPFTNRQGKPDLFDERVAQDVIASTEQYIAINKAMPTSVGVDRYELAELNKARDAGVALTVKFRGKPTAILYRPSNEGYRPTNLRRNHEVMETGK
jgi:hypothetical protein